MIRYKATGAGGKTRGGMQWAVGKTNRSEGKGSTLCTNGVLHVYETPEQAAFMLPSHAPRYTRLFKVEVPKVVADDGTKQGVKEATALREVSMPVLTVEQTVEIAIRVALLVYKEPGYVRWAEDWLSGKDRSEESARAAEVAVGTANASAWAANAAARAAANTADRAAANTADRAARAAANTADRAANTAARVAGVTGYIDLLSIIARVLSKEGT